MRGSQEENFKCMAAYYACGQSTTFYRDDDYRENDYQNPGIFTAWKVISISICRAASVQLGLYYI